MDNGGQRDLRRRVDEDGVRVEDLFEEFVDARPQTFGIAQARETGLDVDHQTLQRPKRVMDCQVIVELLHQQQLVVQDDGGGPLAVALQVAHELVHGHVELLHFARQVHASHPKSDGSALDINFYLFFLFLGLTESLSVGNP